VRVRVQKRPGPKLISLGKIIAWLEKSEQDAIADPEGKEYSDEFIRCVFNEYQQLCDDSRYEAAIPQLRCSNDSIFLVNNTTFILAHILFGYASDLKREETRQFIRHLNDCSLCFEAYCAVFHDYYSALNC
jgi:hypothetical protein